MPFAAAFRQLPVSITDAGAELVCRLQPGDIPLRNLLVHVTDRALRLEWRHEESTELRGDGDYRYSQVKASYSQMVGLPCAVRAAEGRAAFQNGVLTIVLPKAEPTPYGGYPSGVPGVIL